MQSREEFEALRELTREAIERSRATRERVQAARVRRAAKRELAARAERGEDPVAAVVDLAAPRAVRDPEDQMPGA